MVQGWNLRYAAGARTMPSVSVMVASAKTKLMPARPTPSNASSGFRNTLNA